MVEKSNKWNLINDGKHSRNLQTDPLITLNGFNEFNEMSFQNAFEGQLSEQLDG